MSRHGAEGDLTRGQFRGTSEELTDEQRRFDHTRDAAMSLEFSPKESVPSGRMHAGAKQRMHAGVLSLAVSTFAIGVAEFSVVSIPPAVADDLSISLESAELWSASMPLRSALAAR